MLLTSGIDGTYPPGLAVAQVATLERETGQMFAQIALRAARRASDRSQHLLVLGRGAALPPRPEEAADGGGGRRRAAQGRRQRIAAAMHATPCRRIALRACEHVVARRRAARGNPAAGATRGSSCSRCSSRCSLNLVPRIAALRSRCGPTSWRWCCCTGASRSRATSAWASPGSSDC